MKPQTGKRKLKPSGIDWIGDVPEGWGVRRIKYLVGGEGTVFMDGDWINSDIIVDNGVRYLTSGNVGVGVFKRQGNGHITDETFKELNCLKALPGDLMLCRLNEPLGRGCIIPDDEAYYVIAVDNVILRPEKDYDKRYIMHCVSCDRFSTAALIAASGATMQRISRSDLGRLSIPIPPHDEQKRIAAKLDRLCGRIDELSANLTKEIAALQDYRKSLITECVTKGLNPKAKMKPSGVDWIGDVPLEWNVDKIKYHYSVITGNGFPVELQGVEVGDFPVCKASDISTKGKFVNSTKNWVSKDTVEYLGFNVIPRRSIVFPKIGEAMKKNSRKIAAVDCCVDNNCQGVFSRDVDEGYGYYAFLCIDMRLFDNHGPIPCLNNQKLKDYLMPIPPCEEQREIAAYLDKHCAAIDAKIDERQRQLEKLAEYRASAIYEYVTGKKEVAG